MDFSYNFPLSANIGYIVEERLVEAPHAVSFAWMLDSSDEAVGMLGSLVELYGDTRLYTAYINITIRT